jgi:hypothetical protein
VGIQYRKSFKAGPVRITASKSGISYSAGVKGARITKRADGRVQATASAPGTGLRHTSTLGSKPRSRKASQARQGRTRPAAKPLGGGRATITPRQRYTAEAVLEAKGYLGSISVSASGIEVRRSKLGRLAGNRSSTISWEQLAAIDFLAPNIVRNGYVHFVTAGEPRGLSATGRGNRLAAVARNPHTVMFTWQQKRRYKKLRAALEDSVG